MSKRSDVQKLKARAANLRKIAEQSKTKVGRHVAQKMATQVEQAAAKAEAENATKH